MKSQCNEVARAKLGATYELHRPKILRRCQRLLQDAAAADDATQEVFLRVMRHLDSMPDDENETLSWMLRIAANYCFNVRRDSHRRNQSLETYVELTPDSADHTLAVRDEAAQVLADTPEKLSRPATLYYLEGLEQKEVAHRLGLSRRTVIKRLQTFVERARRRSRRGMGADRIAA
jgi:RNA polymerase sigma-70 factor, ECF subfamily